MPIRFGVNHANALISLSQVSETLCILLIPFVLKHFGIKRVMLIAMLAWVLRFGIVRLGILAGVWMFVLSMIVYTGWLSTSSTFLVRCLLTMKLIYPSVPVLRVVRDYDKWYWRYGGNVGSSGSGKSFC